MAARPKPPLIRLRRPRRALSTCSKPGLPEAFFEMSSCPLTESGWNLVRVMGVGDQVVVREPGQCRQTV